MSKHEERAKELFREGYSCSQAILVAFAPELGLTDSQAAKLGSSFGGGLASMREVCGAFSGLAIAAGILYGHDDPKDYEWKKAHYKQLQDMADAYRAENGSIVCKDLLGLTQEKLSNVPEERTPAYYKKRPCVELVGCAARILDQCMEEHPTEV